LLPERTDKYFLILSRKISSLRDNSTSIDVKKAIKFSCLKSDLETLPEGIRLYCGKKSYFFRKVKREACFGPAIYEDADIYLFDNPTKISSKLQKLI
jgi:hypothetical protein